MMRKSSFSAHLYFRGIANILKKRELRAKRLETGILLVWNMPIKFDYEDGRGKTLL